MTPEAFVDRVRTTYRLDPDSEQLLQHVEASLRRYQAAQTALQTEDHYHLSTRGRLQPHPALAVVHQETALQTHLVRRLARLLR